MSNKENLEKLQFTTKKEFKSFLKKYFADLAKTDELMLFAHQINDRDSFHGREPIMKLRGVLKSGLEGRLYGSSDGTLRNVGYVSDDETIDRVLDYDYHSYEKRYSGNFLPTVILAFPRYVIVDGQQIDFTMSRYTLDKPNYIEEINTLFKQRSTMSLSTDPQYAPKSWLDVKYGFDDYDRANTLFAFYKDEKGTYHVILPHTHYVYMEQTKYEQYKSELSKMIKDENCDLDTALVKKAEKYQVLVDDSLNDFD